MKTQLLTSLSLSVNSMSVVNMTSVQSRLKPLFFSLLNALLQGINNGEECGSRGEEKGPEPIR